MMHPIAAIAFVVVTLGAMMLGVRVAQRRLALEAELSRKLVHIGMGLVCLMFPWLFREAWPVWTLAGIAVIGLGAIRLLPLVKAQLGQVLGGVERESWGELLFPLAVAFVFTLARGEVVLFCVPVAILALADATAALIGKRYGYARYETDDGWKSVEGSAAFLGVAFLTTCVGLWLGANLGGVELLLIAVVMGLILMLMEAIAWRGLDNLFVPLVSYVCLVRLLALSVAELTVRLVVLVLVIVALSFWRQSTRLTQSAAIGMGLVLYVTWAAGGWYWLLAPMATGAAYTLLCLRPARTPQRHTVHAIACIGGVGLCWLCLAQIIGTVNTVYAYGVGYGANLAMIALAAYAERCPRRRLVPATTKAVGLGCAALAIPYLIVWRHNANALPLAGWGLALVLAAAMTFIGWQPKLYACPTDAARWTRQGLISALASAIAFAVISRFEPWSKSFE
jgi:phytol kinase